MRFDATDETNTQNTLFIDESIVFLRLTDEKCYQSGLNLFISLLFINIQDGETLVQKFLIKKP